MTRLAVLADIHGNLPALQAVAADLAAGDVDHVMVATARTQVVPFLSWRAAHHPGTPITWALLDEFMTVDPWEYIPPLFRLDEHRARPASA